MEASRCRTARCRAVGLALPRGIIAGRIGANAATRRAIAASARPVAGLNNRQCADRLISERRFDRHTAKIFYGTVPIHQFGIFMTGEPHSTVGRVRGRRPTIGKTACDTRIAPAPALRDLGDGAPAVKTPAPVETADEGPILRRCARRYTPPARPGEPTPGLTTRFDPRAAFKQFSTRSDRVGPEFERATVSERAHDSGGYTTASRGVRP